jgi:DNA-binding winged helix-turn-helix (wHTH) protein
MNGMYEFAGFVLDPKERALRHHDKPVDLVGKDLDILIYFVRRPGELISRQDIVAAIWPQGVPANPSTLRNHINKVRRALGDDAAAPRFIKTHHGDGAYRFIAGVERSEAAPWGRTASPGDGSTLEIESHFFIPIYCGRGGYDRLNVPERETQWTGYKEFKIDDGRLCIMPSAVGVWHLIETGKFESLTAFARWRKQTYEKILSGRHALTRYNKNLFAHLSGTEKRILNGIWCKPAYVFSMLVLNGSPWKTPERLRKPMQVLSNLSPLERADPKSIDALERKLLDISAPSTGVREFGSPDADLGFASWDSVSYHCFSDRSPSFKNVIIEFEIAVQATWWLSKCVNDVLLADEAEDIRDMLRPPVAQLKRQYARLQNIAATESPRQRTMIEAVLSTSRLERLVNETLRLYSGA